MPPIPVPFKVDVGLRLFLRWALSSLPSLSFPSVALPDVSRCVRTYLIVVLQPNKMKPGRILLSPAAVDLS